MTEAFARLIWTYDTRVNTYEQWQTAIGGLIDPNGPPASGEVARGMLPLWPQWEDLARQRARARVTTLRTTVPAEMSALEHDPRAPTGWRGFVVDATQEITTDVTAGRRTSTTARRASIAVVCVSRCYLWSATPEAPRWGPR